MAGRLPRILSQLKDAAFQPARTLAALRTLTPWARGMTFAEAKYRQPAWPPAASPREAGNPLLAYFDAHREGPGIWKWRHYFDIYHRHFARFVGREVHVMELGVYSGGSLDMWRGYFGDKCRVYGVDIEPACQAYARDGVTIFTGDQSDRAFWARVRAAAPRVDIFIDDGGHHPEHQIVTLEEMLPHVAPGGVYICEDVHGAPNFFASYAYGMASQLNSTGWPDFLAAIEAMHFYPYMAVIEKCDRRREPTRSEKHGTQWQPFYQGKG